MELKWGTFCEIDYQQLSPLALYTKWTHRRVDLSMAAAQLICDGHTYRIWQKGTEQRFLFYACISQDRLKIARIFNFDFE